MALRLSLQMLAKQSLLCSNVLSTSTRGLTTSSPLFARRVKAEEKLTSDQAFDLLDDDFDDDDTASAGHLMLRQHRQVLYYLRLIEHEMPKLVGAFLLENP